MKLIVAESKYQADNTAIIDWGWQRGPKGYVDKSGDAVTYVNRTEQLYGLQRGSVTVYLGYGWYKNRDLEHLQEICQAREYTMSDGPE